MRSPPEVTGPVNLGKPGEFTIYDLAKIVIDLTGSSSKIVHQPLPADYQRQRRPEITLAGDVLGWVPTITLETGLKRTIPYFESLLSSGVMTAV